MNNHAMLILAVLLLPACEFLSDVYGPGDETGGDAKEYPCTTDAKCILADLDDPRVQEAIDNGDFIFHSMGTCEDRGPTWYTLQKYEKFLTGAPRLRAAYCGDMGFDGPTSGQTSFAICLPQMGAWDSPGLVGAIGRADATIWVPHCDEVPKFAFAYDYVFAAPCYETVSCYGFDTQCGCTCQLESYECSDTQSALSTSYFDDPDTLSEAGWELACTGEPLFQDAFSGSWAATTCEFNQPDPML